MKSKLIILCLAFSALSLSVSKAEAKSGGPFGVGIVLGDPSALTMKYEIDETSAWDGGIAFNLSKWILVYGDWDYKFAGAFSRGGARGLSNLTPYLGAGLVLVVSNSSDSDTRGFRYFDSSSSSRVALGLRIPLGIEWKPADTPIGVFVEIAPGLTIVPATYAFVQGGLGIRFFF